ncbi:MAG: hypothetical protein BroJett006_12230 [Betaproteobacteria bacterium]|nr:MAG: hypothetical protein BroJett006_12230 [Betaproteobacteria bacterium]
MSLANYLFDEKTGFWCKPGYQSIGYTDGDDTEDRLLSILRQCVDVSSGSKMLLERISDWPTEYHLSPARHNLLRPFNIGRDNSVLELGCGCGAISRYLGETGARVVAVEGSRKRAQISAERCRDLSNVLLVCDNISEFETSERFDFITLIGVLEYAPLFINDSYPLVKLLRHARTMLKEDGVVLVAIENQLGLKYFNGRSEDHTGIPFFGLHGLYSGSTPVTYGKNELESMLRRAGFEHIDFHYPFPDYKLPNIILSDEGARHHDFSASELLYRSESRDYATERPSWFREFLVWRVLHRNGMLPALSNSFLILAGPQSLSDRPSNWLARTYTSQRLAEFSVETVFRNETNRITVSKQLVSPGTQMPSAAIGPLNIRHTPAERSRYVPGQLHAAELIPIMARGGGLDDVAAWAGPWLALLKRAASRNRNVCILPGEWLDAIPSNLVLTDSGTLELIDQEWKADDAVPLSWVIIRGFYSALSACPLSPRLRSHSFRDVVGQVVAAANLDELTDPDYQQAAILENELQSAVCIRNLQGQRMLDVMNAPLGACCLPGSIHDALAAQDAEIHRIKSSLSWRISAPLRVLQNALRRLWN